MHLFGFIGEIDNESAVVQCSGEDIGSAFCDGNDTAGNCDAVRCGGCHGIAVKPDADGIVVPCGVQIGFAQLHGGDDRRTERREILPVHGTGFIIRVRFRIRCTLFRL